MNVLPVPLVQLHYAHLSMVEDEIFLAQVFAWLSDAEQARYQCFANKQQASQYLLARALLRSQLSERVSSVQPHEWIFEIDEHGKPRLADAFSHFNIQFNLSHSENMVVLALCSGLELGVDVECIHRPVFSMALARRYFAKTEFADLLKLNEQQQIKRITQLWTLKESYLKASGLGIRVPLDKLVFCYEGESGLRFSGCSSLASIFPSNKVWQTGLFSLGADYSLALTVKADNENCGFSIESSEWVGQGDQASNLKCALLRKTTDKYFCEMS